MIVRMRQAGLTLVEVLVALVLLALLLIPTMGALRTSVVGAAVHTDVAASHYRLASRLEELLVEPFDDLVDAAAAAGGPDAPTTYSEAAGPPSRLIVYLSPYDGDDADSDGNPYSGTDPNLMWIRVDIEGSVHTLQTVRARGF